MSKLVVWSDCCFNWNALELSNIIISAYLALLALVQSISIEVFSDPEALISTPR